jgi:hypothetical protein
MSFEGPSAREALDSRWYKRFEALTFETYAKFEGSAEWRRVQRESFLKGEIDNPVLDYPELERFEIEEREKMLLSLKTDILEQERNEIVKKIYRTKINEVIAELRMLRAAKNGDDHKFAHYSTFIYGRPQGEDLRYVCASVQTSAREKLETGELLQKEAAQRLLALLPELQVSDQKVMSDVLPEGERIEGYVADVAEVVHEFREALTELGLDEWEIVVGSERFNVSQEHKEVRIPSAEILERRQLSKRKLKGLVAHEIGTHALRRHNGERSALHLLGLGLDRYLKGEEGVAMYNEQQVTGAKEFAGIARYFSIAVARGLRGFGRDFRETFEVMRDYRIVLGNGSPESMHRADESAYDDCVRIFRGSTCRTPGAVFSKDLAYFGNREVWNLVSKNSDVVQTFSIGKFDPTNESHVAFLSQLGILDQDLEKIESGTDS